MSVFSKSKKSHLKKTMFFDEQVDIARYDKVKYSQFDKLTDKQLSFFWRPEEVDITKDYKDFKTLPENERHIFTSNLKRQILLDSVQGRAPTMALGPIVSLPELETWIQTWTFSETIHSKSYTHLIRNIYSDPAEVFDGMTKMKEIMDCAHDISEHYDDLINFNAIKHIRDNQSWYSTIWNWVFDKFTYDEYEHKKALWLCLNAVNALEGVRFYVSFACSWNFAEQKKMEGNAKIIKLIARDENLHLASTQQMLKLLPKDDKDFAKIKKECEEEVTQIFVDVVQQEVEWAKYLMKYGSMIGVNEQILTEYTYWIAKKRMAAIGLSAPFDAPTSNPIPWTQSWIAGSEVQVAPQETEITSYTIGSIKQDVNEDSFKGFSL